MFFNPQPLFVIVGYPNVGKRKVLQEIFARKNFFPLKDPFIPVAFPENKFVVINRTNHRGASDTLCTHLSHVMSKHIFSSAAFMLMLSFILDGGRRDARRVVQYLEASGCLVHYLVLAGSWEDKRVLTEEALEPLLAAIGNGRIHYFDRLVTRSPLRFQQRTEEVTTVIRSVLAGSHR
ncbi:hypothetical protein SAMN04488128_1021218 [Chitinophaga eiseniae]|uniref:Uncharacterized protein n=1 Tax=Chitinophaga eiseniae TaxID=634771 RepID=A0A1T4RJA7_9BACT|nr:hypothetical protein [Chitinophaga eiseniae]SKA16090.1 hypothetical protein SAMN04488128_1021218 [Chitinophaga eiseniae]